MSSFDGTVEPGSRKNVFVPVAAPSTYEETVARLGIAIRIGVLKAGAKLPPERDLAEQLGISRSTLRQALATLTQTGHLVAVRGRAGGTFVSDQPPVVSVRPFPLERGRALLDWRQALELGIVRLATERSSSQDHMRLSEATAYLEDDETLSDAGTFRRADAGFHLVLAEAARSHRLIDAMTRLQGELSDLLHHVDLPMESRNATNREHRAVSDAVRDGNSDGAVEAMRAHLEATERLVADVLPAR